MSCAMILTGVWGAMGIGLKNAEIYGLGMGEAADGSDPGRPTAYIQGAYGLDDGEWTDACIARETGASAVELAVLCFADEAAARHGYDRLKDYLHGREGDFTGYAPAQAKLVADAALVAGGLYVGLFIVENSDFAGRTFSDIVETGEIPEPVLEPEPEPIEGVEGLLEILLSSCESSGDDVSNLERVDGGDPDKLKSIIEDTYGVADGAWAEAAIARGIDGSVFEIAVLRTADGMEDRDQWKIVDTLTQEYLDVKEAEYARFPAQAEMLGNAIAGNPHDSDFIILAICSDPRGVIWNAAELLGSNGYSSAQRHFKETRPVVENDPDYSDRVKFDPPNEDDMSIYDTSAIRAAWAAGDPSGLSEKDLAVYDAAREILGDILTDGMTGLEQETAIYTWLVNNVDYDWTHQDVMMETPRTAYEPYGGLVDRTAVCLGYAASFQLLMDLAGVECITVVGACFNSEGDHAWNMVRLDGKWYCVDVTWDANGREQLGDDYTLRYFNVTSDEMAKNHQWDYANTPEATA